MRKTRVLLVDDERLYVDSLEGLLKGGDLGWISPGDTVPNFEEAMNELAPKEISPPFKSSFGWHIVQVLDRRQADTTAEVMRQKAKDAIRQRKAREAKERRAKRESELPPRKIIVGGTRHHRATDPNDFPGHPGCRREDGHGH